MSRVFHGGRWYENTVMVCACCKMLVYKSDNPEYVYQCLHCNEDLYSFEVEEAQSDYATQTINTRLRSTVVIQYMDDCCIPAFWN